jgi:cellulose synthase/poly-beta-1,6-N-acetylglucosamine synthase-like glycosyltransferase
MDPRVKFFPQASRRGKPAVLNALIKQAQGDILVFVDARQELEKNAIAELVSNFFDPRVGSVSGQLVFRKKDGAGKAASGVGLYWRYEKFLRSCESRAGSMLGATGALYAVKRALCPPLPADIILDDVFIPMTIVQKGYRAIYDETAIIYDDVASNPKGEFARKTRTLAGNFQLFYYLRRLFNPLRGMVSWQFFSHKVLRLMVPFLLASLLVSNLFLLKEAPYFLIFVLQLVFYGLATAGYVFKRSNRLTDVPVMFCVMNAAAVIGLIRFLMHKQMVQWEKAGDAI